MFNAYACFLAVAREYRYSLRIIIIIACEPCRAANSPHLTAGRNRRDFGRGSANAAAAKGGKSRVQLVLRAAHAGNDGNTGYLHGYDR